MSKQTTNLVSSTKNQSKAAKALKSAANAAAFEVLEGRQMFSALTITGTGLDDVIRINQTGSLVMVNVNGATRATRRAKGLLAYVAEQGLDVDRIVQGWPMRDNDAILTRAALDSLLPPKR